MRCGARRRRWRACVCNSELQCSVHSAWQGRSCACQPASTWPAGCARAKPVGPCLRACSAPRAQDTHSLQAWCARAHTCGHCGSTRATTNTTRWRAWRMRSRPAPSMAQTKRRTCACSPAAASTPGMCAPAVPAELCARHRAACPLSWPGHSGNSRTCCERTWTSRRSAAEGSSLAGSG